MLENRIRIISAGAGSGKTSRLTGELFDLLKGEHSSIRPEGIVATTFTRKAAAELMERLRSGLFEKKQSATAEKVSSGFIGTVNSICGALLQHVAFEAGLSPALDVIAEEDQQLIFNRALAEVVTEDLVDLLEETGERLGRLDWKANLKNIVDAARSNNIQADSLSDSSVRSVSGLKAFFPNVSGLSACDLDKKLKDSVCTAVQKIRLNSIDTAKVTKTYLDMLEGYEARIKQGQHLAWEDWVTLANAMPAKKSEHLADPVREAASLHAEHPRFHEDVQQYINTIFDLAAAVIDHYQAYKQERGLIDFADQESLLLNALDLPEVQERLADELDLLLVDEFQDTSPIQLALFLKLTGIVRQSIWVGDPKQSIYAFRGADPALMAAVTRTVPVRADDIQTTSFRSRVDLVNFVNGLFVPALADILPREQVELMADRPEPEKADNALHLWPLNGSNKKKRIAEVADGIAGMIAAAPVIRDKHTGVDRNAKPGDIAVLCRGNDDCKDLADVLNQLGIRTAIGRPGLLETPEGKLILASLRYYHSQYDTLANAEIQVLTSEDPKPEEWLADRLLWLDTEGKSHEWGIGHPVLTAIRKLSEHSAEFSPSEALDEIVEAIDVRRLLFGWGESERRLGNLENLRMMVRTYEDSCLRQMSAATIGGLLLWLNDLAASGKDSQSEGRGTEAVNIVTCHSSKGLEWPIVVVATLDSSLRERVWGVSVCDERAEVPLMSPLEGRWIRFWPWPYGKKSVKTGLNEKIAGTATMLNASTCAAAEELRLLYVTLTRARDYLVLCLNMKGSPWLDLALHKAQLALPELNKDQTVSVDWVKNRKGTYEKLDFTVSHPKPATAMDAGQKDNKWLAERSGRLSYPPARVNPSGMVLSEGVSAFCCATSVTGKRLLIDEKAISQNGTPAYYRLGDALHSFIAVDHKRNRPVEERKAMLENLMGNFGVSGSLASSDVLANCDGFYRFVDGLNPLRIFTEWPVQMKIDNQVMIGTADMILEREDGWIVVDHKSFPGTPEQWGDAAIGYAGQLKAYSDAVIMATGKPVCGMYVHFVVGGGVLEIRI